MPFHGLLVETMVHMPPAPALDGLSPAHADRRPEGVSHSISEIVAHMAFWQAWFLRRIDGAADRLPAHAAEGWPPVAPGSWPEARDTFLAGLARAAAVGADEGRLDQLVDPAIEFPPFAHYTVRDALLDVAVHNAHHLGQVILLRQLIGAWPPPAGSFTW